MPRQIVRLVLAVLILASLFGGRSLVANVADGSQHVVKPGETLSGIAAQYGLTVDQLVTLNGITDPDRLAEGQTLKLPTAPPRATAGAPSSPPTTASTGPSPAAGSAPSAQSNTQSASRPTEYVVQSGDTLSGIAKALGVSLKALLDANEIADPDRLTLGQKLSLPAGASLPAAPSSGTTASGSPAAKPAQASSSTSTASAPASGPPDEVGPALDKLAQQYGIDPSLVRALAWIDTDGKPRKLDAPGGIGYLTVTDKTFEYIQQSLVKRTLDRANPLDNLEAGVAYVASMLKWGGEEPKGLAAFLQGPGSVRANGVRPAIEQEVKRVLALRDRLKQGGPATAGSGLGAGTGQSAAGSGGTQSAAPAASTAGRSADPTPPTTPTTEPKLSTGESTANLAAKAIGAARTVAGPNGRIGISGRNLVTGQRLSVGADQSFPAASVGKLALLVELYRQTSSGSLALSDEQRADLRAMIIQSDNDAANRLLELLKPKTINATLQTLGLVGTKLVNPFGLASATGNPANVTTPGDMTRLMELLASEQLVSPQASREMRGLLLQSQDSSKLRRGLPSDARVAHKSGWYDGVANDVGLITQGQSSYVLGVFTEGMIDAETANQAIAAVAKAVHGAWGLPSPGSDPVASRHR